MLFRAMVEADLDNVLACTVTESVGQVGPDRYRAKLADRQYRPEWTWLAESSGRILARAVWWGQPDHDHPGALDCLYVHPSVEDRVGFAADLLTAAQRTFGDGEAPAYHLNLPNGWRNDPVVSAEVAWRQAAAAKAGLVDVLERLRFEWTPDVGLPRSNGRLVFSAEPDDDRFVEVLRRVAEDSLDVTTRRSVAAMGADTQARDDVAFYRGMLGERSWWRLAHTSDGRLAGFAMPNRNVHGPVVGYLGIVPEMRGQGYIDDVLAEIVRIHTAAGAQRIIATTDTANRPMAAAFERAGFRNYETRLVLSVPPAVSA